ncbi:MAG: bacillithiol biosynthesis cysteine-adding enzyme BshC [Candidatus Firestonebacteria bacterium]|nr:bacillithiol biosynthesis cysteine-adding enzyme BshC [Candidatus Firestonebacteria bacterium]
MKIIINKADMNITFNKKFPSAYISDYNKVKHFFPDPPFDIKNIEEVIKTRLKAMYPRQELFKLLENRDNKYGDKTRRNIKLLQKENTLCILTGQQPDLLTGPLYIIYKALSIIKLSEILTNIYPQYNFVPIFWVSSFDHDIEEINQFTIPDKNHIPITFSFDIPKSKTPVSHIDINSRDITNLKSFLKETLTPTEFTDELLDNIETTGINTFNINKFFITIMQNLFNKWGLIILDGSNANLNKLGIEIYENEIMQPGRLNEIVRKNDILLAEAGFHSQVKLTPGSCNFFVEKNNERKKVIFDKNKFIIDSEEFSSSMLISKLHSNPELFSPNVILRPILQDYILPTLIYMGGPSEISYFGQFINEGYKIFNITSPIIWPRASVTIIENSINEISDKYKIDLKNFLKEKNKPADITKNVINIKSGYKIDDIFNKYIDLLNIAGKALCNDLIDISPEILSYFNKINTNYNNDIKKFKNKLIQNLKSNEEIAVKQILKFYNNLLPLNEYQERKINIFYYINKYGLQILDNIYDSITVDKPEHSIFIILP